MRSVIIAGLVFCAFLFSGWKLPEFPQKTTSADSAKVDYKIVGAPLPPLRFFTREKKYLTEKDFPAEKNLIIMLFNPTCEHCEDQAIIFKNNLDALKQTNLVLVAAPMMGEHLTFFTNNTKIGEIAEMPVSLDSCGFIDKMYKYGMLPQINIYNKEKRLVKIYSGSVPIDSISRYLIP